MTAASKKEEGKTQSVYDQNDRYHDSKERRGRLRSLITNEDIQHENDREEQIDDHHGIKSPVRLGKHVTDRVVLAAL
jgi:hypothetical protein